MHHPQKESPWKDKEARCWTPGYAPSRGRPERVLVHLTARSAHYRGCYSCHSSSRSAAPAPALCIARPRCVLRAIALRTLATTSTLVARLCASRIGPHSFLSSVCRVLGLLGFARVLVSLVLRLFWVSGFICRDFLSSLGAYRDISFVMNVVLCARCGS